MTPVSWCYLKGLEGKEVSVLILVVLAFLIITSIGMLYLGSRVTDLPLPHAVMDSSRNPSRALTVIFSGPSGWVEFDQGLAESFITAGFDVRGIDYLRYFFWKKRAPAQLADDLGKMIREWLEARAGNGQVVLVGYSKGADVLPFAVNLLDAELRSRVQLVALVSVSRLADFRLRLKEVLHGGFGPFALKVGPEIKKLENLPGLCIYGNQDRVSLCRNLKGISNTMEVREVQGGRIFNDSKVVADLILEKYEKEALKNPVASLKDSTPVFSVVSEKTPFRPSEPLNESHP